MQLTSIDLNDEQRDIMLHGCCPFFTKADILNITETSKTWAQIIINAYKVHVKSWIEYNITLLQPKLFGYNILEHDRLLNFTSFSTCLNIFDIRIATLKKTVQISLLLNSCSDTCINALKSDAALETFMLKNIFKHLKPMSAIDAEIVKILNQIRLALAQAPQSENTIKQPLYRVIEDLIVSGRCEKAAFLLEEHHPTLSIDDIDQNNYTFAYAPFFSSRERGLAYRHIFQSASINFKKEAIDITRTKLKRLTYFEMNLNVALDRMLTEFRRNGDEEKAAILAAAMYRQELPNTEELEEAIVKREKEKQHDYATLNQGWNYLFDKKYKDAIAAAIPVFNTDKKVRILIDIALAAIEAGDLHSAMEATALISYQTSRDFLYIKIAFKQNGRAAIETLERVQNKRFEIDHICKMIPGFLAEGYLTEVLDLTCPIPFKCERERVFKVIAAHYFPTESVFPWLDYANHMNSDAIRQSFLNYFFSSSNDLKDAAALYSGLSVIIDKNETSKALDLICNLTNKQERRLAFYLISGKLFPDQDFVKWFDEINEISCPVQMRSFIHHLIDTVNLTKNLTETQSFTHKLFIEFLEFANFDNSHTLNLINALPKTWLRLELLTEFSK